MAKKSLARQAAERKGGVQLMMTGAAQRTVLRVQRSLVSATGVVQDFEVLYEASGTGQYAHHAAFVTVSATKPNRFDVHTSRDGGTSFIASTIEWKHYEDAVRDVDEDVRNYGRTNKTCYQKWF